MTTDKCPPPRFCAEFIEQRLAEHQQWLEKKEQEELEAFVALVLAATDVPHEC